jgi:hypothetical protein
MTDRKLLELAFDVVDIYREHDAKGEGFADQVYVLLRDRLAQPVHTSDTSEERVQISDKHRHEWVGLTEEELNAIAPIRAFKILAKLVEAKLKEKNT